MYKKISFGVMLATVATLMAPRVVSADDTVTLAQFDLDLSGLVGPAGPQGPAGTGINYKGEVENCTELAALTGMADGDAWYNRQDTLLYIYEGKFPSCPDGGVPFRGPEGPQGKPGDDGKPACAPKASSTQSLDLSAGVRCVTTTLTPMVWSSQSRSCIVDLKQEVVESKVCDGAKGLTTCPPTTVETTETTKEVNGQTLTCSLVREYAMELDSKGKCSKVDPSTPTKESEICQGLKGQDAEKVCAPKLVMSSKDANGCVMITRTETSAIGDNCIDGATTTETVCDAEEKCPVKVTKTESTERVNGQDVDCATITTRNQVFSKTSNKCVDDPNSTAESTKMCAGANGTNGGDGTSCSTTQKELAEGVFKIGTKCGNNPVEETIIKTPCDNAVKVTDTTVEGKTCKFTQVLPQTRDDKGTCAVEVGANPITSYTTCNGTDGKDPECPNSITTSTVTQSGKQCTKVTEVAQKIGKNGCAIDSSATAKESVICPGDNGEDAPCPNETAVTESSKEVDGKTVTCANLTTYRASRVNGSCVADYTQQVSAKQVCDGKDAPDTIFTAETDSDGSVKFYAKTGNAEKVLMGSSAPQTTCPATYPYGPYTAARQSVDSEADTNTVHVEVYCSKTAQ